MESLGVAIRLSKAHYRAGEPVVLRGAYKADDELRRRTGDTLSSWITLVCVRRDRPGVRSRPFVDGHNRIVQPYPADKPLDPSFRVTGFFNVDIARALAEPGGRYWVTAYLGDFVSERLGFEIET